MKQTILIFFFIIQMVSASAPTIQQQCNSEFSKVGVCLDYAAGKADFPSNSCCSTVKEIRDSQPVCLCYVIQLVHQGEASLRQMGVQQAKLIQIPSACKLANSSLSNCPRLLNLSPASPDYAIFMNSTSSPPTVGSTQSSQTNENTSIMLAMDLHYLGLIVISLFITMLLV